MSQEPQITVSILSWLLEDRLIKTLKSIPISTSMPLALCLHVQGEEQISREKRKEIYKAASGFVTQDICFTPFNNGVAVPRASLLKRSAKTPYVFITDNDMDFTEGSIDALYEFLEDSNNAQYGSVNLVDNTLRWHRRVDTLHNRVTYFPISLNPPKVIDIDLCGACCTLIRSKIAKVPNIIDTKYYLGTWDIDLCMNIKSLGYKQATLCDENYVAFNDVTYRTDKYLSIKGLTPTRLEGIKRFMEKWSIDSEVNRLEALEIKSDYSDLAIITRAIYNSLGNNPGIGVLTKSRLNLMQNFYINSLNNQINKNFTLYLYVGSETNKATKAIKALNWHDLDVKFIYVNNSLSEWKESIEDSGNWGRETDPGCPEELVRRQDHPKHTIMARLDNDDWVAPGWTVHMVHMAMNKPESRFLINYRVMGQAPDGRLYKFFMQHTRGHVSPFLALVQKEGLMISPYADIHLKMGRMFKVYTIPPAYVFMVIGDDNRSNHICQHDKYFEDIEVESPLTIAKPKPKAKQLSKPISINKPLKSNSSWQARIQAIK